MARLEADHAARHEAAMAEMEMIYKEKEELRREVLLLRMALQNNVPRGEELERVKMPEPKAYNGMRSAPKSW